jgi:hypothetical protein
VPYLTLDRAILPPPAPAIIALGMVLGTWWIAGRIASRLWRERPMALRRSLCFGATVGTLGALVHASFVFAPAPAVIFSGAGLSLAALGLLQLAEWVRAAEPFSLNRCMEGLSWVDKLGVGIASLIGLALLLAALGPPTDADSLDYHLGVPLEWLRQGHAVARRDWLTNRTAGLGEALNLLGLAAGTDCFGAVRQAAALPMAVASVTVWAQDSRRRALGALLVLAVPALLFLVPSQKPQLLPAVLLTVALVAVLDARDRLDRSTLATAGACIGYAIASKYSFLLTGAVVWIAIFEIARRQAKLPWAVGVAVVTVLLLPGPVWLHNWFYYGDPLSPILERFRSHPDPAVVGYAQYLREYGGRPTLARILRLPIDLILTTHPGEASTVLGAGVLGFVGALRCRGGQRVLLFCALGACLATILAGQISPRFFLEPYLWAAAATVAAPWGRWLSILRGALIVQSMAVATMAIAGAVFLLPGALTGSARSQTMEKYAPGYAQARWMDRVLPKEAVVIAETRSHALVPRPFVATLAFWYLPTRQARIQQLERLIRERPVTAVVAYAPRDPTLDALSPCATGDYGPPVAFEHAARNPFNRRVSVQFRAFPVDLKSANCRLSTTNARVAR